MRRFFVTALLAALVCLLFWLCGAVRGGEDGLMALSRSTTEHLLQSEEARAVFGFSEGEEWFA